MSNWLGMNVRYVTNGAPGWWVCDGDHKFAGPFETEGEALWWLREKRIRNGP